MTTQSPTPEPEKVRAALQNLLAAWDAGDAPKFMATIGTARLALLAPETQGAAGKCPHCGGGPCHVYESDQGPYCSACGKNRPRNATPPAAEVPDAEGLVEFRRKLSEHACAVSSPQAYTEDGARRIARARKALESAYAARKSAAGEDTKRLDFLETTNRNLVYRRSAIAGFLGWACGEHQYPQATVRGCIDKAREASPSPPAPTDEAVRDSERMNWLTEMPDCCVEMRRTGMGKPKWRCFGDPSKDGYDSPREAIDAIRAALKLGGGG